jgi:hypothetical protein
MIKSLILKNKSLLVIVCTVLVIGAGILANYFYHRDVSFNLIVKDRQEWLEDEKEAKDLREKTKNNILTKEQVNNLVDTVAGINTINKLIKDSALQIDPETQILGKDALTNKYIQIAKKCNPVVWGLKDPLRNPPPAHYNSCNVYLYYLLSVKPHDEDDPAWLKECASVGGNKVIQQAYTRTELLCTVVKR